MVFERNRQHETKSEQEIQSYNIRPTFLLLLYSIRIRMEPKEKGRNFKGDSIFIRGKKNPQM